MLYSIYNIVRQLLPIARIILAVDSQNWKSLVV